MLNDAVEWTMTGVYGPQSEQDKISFLEEIKTLRQGLHDQPEWLIVGDFNLIYKADDKNNSRLNRSLMGKLLVLQDLDLKELSLNGRKFTWTSNQNPQVDPMMTRIDRAFWTIEWEERFPTAHLQAWTSAISDHCPLILQVCKPKELGGSEFMTSTALVERFADGGSSTVGWMNRNHGRG
jgi:exonuclease III